MHWRQPTGAVCRTFDFYFFDHIFRSALLDSGEAPAVASVWAFSFLRALLGLRESSPCALLREYVGKLAFFPLPHGTGRDFEKQGKLGLCQAEPLAVRFELFRKAHAPPPQTCCTGG